MARVRVLVVEDSLTVRRHLVETLSADPEVEVVGETGDGQVAVDLCQALRPSVVTLDMVLAGLDGQAATEQIMANCPTPILVVSSYLNRGDAFRTFDALSAGAVDVLEKPLGSEAGDDWERRFLARVKLVSRVKVITHPRGRLARRPSDPIGALPLPFTSAVPRVVAMGASTGGPGAVGSVLRGLPPTFPLPFLLVIHIGQQFAESLVRWLDTSCPLRVREARDGEALPPVGRGVVLMPPPDRHLVLDDGRLRLSAGPERHACRPSVDVLFESVAKSAGPAAIGCLLTGMGRDGAAGLLAMRRAGAETLVQDEATSAVWGMPREAVEMGAAGRVVPLSGFARHLVSLVGEGREEGPR